MPLLCLKGSMNPDIYQYFKVAIVCKPNCSIYEVEGPVRAPGL